MTPKSKKALIVIVSLLAIGGGVGYFLWKRKKDKNAEAEAKAKAEAEAKAEADAKAKADAEANTNQGGGGSGSGSGSTTSYTFPFKTVAEGNAFRGWVNKTYPAYAKSIKLDPTGTLNSFVQTAWDKYGNDYNKALGKSGFKAGDKLYVDRIDTAYSYPSKETRYQIGRIRRDGAKVVAKFIRDSSNKGWIVADAIVQDYKGVLSLKKGVFLEAKNYTTIAP
jgi:hypothetical protein